MSQPNENTELKTETSLEDVELKELKQKKLMNLATLLGQLLLDETKVNELKIKLNIEPETFNLLKKMSELFPDLLEDIDDSVSDMVSDNVLDSKDVPKLVVLIKNVYKKFSESKKLRSVHKITLEDSINFIKNLLLILIELDHIKVNDKENVKLVIELCIDLLTATVDAKETLIDLFKSILCC